MAFHLCTLEFPYSPDALEKMEMWQVYNNNGDNVNGQISIRKALLSLRLRVVTCKHSGTCVNCKMRYDFALLKILWYEYNQVLHKNLFHLKVFLFFLLNVLWGNRYDFYQENNAFHSWKKRLWYDIEYVILKQTPLF